MNWSDVVRRDRLPLTQHSFGHLWPHCMLSEAGSNFVVVYIIYYATLLLPSHEPLLLNFLTFRSKHSHDDLNRMLIVILFCLNFRCILKDHILFNNFTIPSIWHHAFFLFLGIAANLQHVWVDVAFGTWAWSLQRVKAVCPSQQGGSKGRHRSPGCPVECHSRIRAKGKAVVSESGIGRREWEKMSTIVRFYQIFWDNQKPHFFIFKNRSNFWLILQDICDTVVVHLFTFKKHLSAFLQMLIRQICI